MEEKNLEELLNSIELREGRGQRFSFVRDLYHKVESKLNGNPLLAGGLTGAVFEALNLIPPSSDMNHLQYFLEAFGAGWVNFYLNSKLEEELEDAPKSLPRKVWEFFWHHPIAITLAATSLNINRAYEGNFERFTSTIDLPHFYTWGRLFLYEYLFASVLIKSIRIGKKIFEPYFYLITAEDIFNRAYKNINPFRKKPFDHVKQQLEGAAKCLELSLNLKYNTTVAVDLTYCYLALDKIEDAWDTFNIMVEQIGREEQFKSASDRFFNWAGRLRSKVRCQQLEDKYEGENAETIIRLAKAFNTLLSGKLGTIDEILTEMIEDSPDVIEVYILRGKHYKGQGESEKVRRDFLKVADLLSKQQDSDKDLILLGHSSRPCWVYDNSILKYTLFRQKATQEEANMAIAVAEIFGDRVAMILDYLKEIGELFQLRVRGKFGNNLYESMPYLTPEERFRIVRQVALFLLDYQLTPPEVFKEHGAELADVLVPGKDPLFGPDYYGNRFRDVFIGELEKNVMVIPKTLKDRLINDGYKIGKIVAQLPKAPYWDANTKNTLLPIIVNPLPADFQRALMKIRGLDWISLTECGSDYLTPEQKAMIFHILRTGHEIPIPLFLRELNFGGAIRHLEFIGYRARDIYNMEDEEKLDNIGAMFYHIMRAPLYFHSVVGNGYVETSQRQPFINFADNLGILESQLRGNYGKDLNRYMEFKIQQAEEIKQMYSLSGRIRSADLEFWKSVAVNGIYISSGTAGVLFLLSKLGELISK